MTTSSAPATPATAPAPAPAPATPATVQDHYALVAKAEEILKETKKA